LVEYTRPYLYPKQRDAIFTPKRWALCEASTKSGKTVASIARFLEWGLVGNGITEAALGQNYWWVAYTSEVAKIAFNRVKLGLTRGTFTPRESPYPSIQLITGPTLHFRSADNPDSLYGEDVFGAIIDEASRCAAEAWYAVRSTLTATRGPAVMIGNVKGRHNWFWEWCRRVQDGLDPNAAYSRITWEDAVAAGVLDLEEIEDARRNLPEAIFRELYEAVASDDSGNPFGEVHILACVRGLSNEAPVAFGIDLAKKQDYLVVTGLDANGRVCVFQRWQGVPWRDSIRRIHEIVGEDTPALVDSTGLGDPVLEELQVGHGNFIGYHFSSVSKQRLMEGLAVSIQGHEITFPDGPIKTELLRFEYELTRTGVRYAAAEGYNDDCVCSLALAREQWSTTAPATNLMAFYGDQAREAQARVKAADLESESVGVERRAVLLTPSEVLDNELSDLYHATLAQYQPEARTCRQCGKAIIGPSRVSDGQFVWHTACVRGFQNQAAA
jgi:hypothetical protein